MKGIDLVDKKLVGLLRSFIEQKEKSYNYHIGKVIDNNDPERIGRCKIRVYGIYSDLIPDSDIPWAVMDSGFVGGTNGSFIVPPIDSLVNVIFQDNDIYNPMYTTKVKSTTNFISDKDEDYPDSMIFFETDTGEYFKINRRTNLSTYRHASGLIIDIDAEGNCTINTESSETGNITINTLGNVTLNCGGDSDIISEGDVSIKSLNGSINLGAGNTPVNNLTNCFFNGAPHYTPTSTIPSKSINVSL
jgi:hypothetical protein